MIVCLLGAEFLMGEQIRRGRMLVRFFFSSGQNSLGGGQAIKYFLNLFLTRQKIVGD